MEYFWVSAFCHIACHDTQSNKINTSLSPYHSIYSNEFDPENPHTAIEKSKPSEPEPVSAIPIQDADAFTHVEGEVVKLTPDKKNSAPPQRAAQQQQQLPPPHEGVNRTSGNGRPQNRNSSSSTRRPMAPTEPAPTPEQTACCSDPNCVIS
jgi:hypothetical protein